MVVYSVLKPFPLDEFPTSVRFAGTAVGRRILQNEPTMDKVNLALRYFVAVQNHADGISRFEQYNFVQHALKIVYNLAVNSSLEAAGAFAEARFKVAQQYYETAARLLATVGRVATQLVQGLKPEAFALLARTYEVLAAIMAAQLADNVDPVLIVKLNTEACIRFQCFGKTIDGGWLHRIQTYLQLNGNKNAAYWKEWAKLNKNYHKDLAMQNVKAFAEKGQQGGAIQFGQTAELMLVKCSNYKNSAGVDVKVCEYFQLPNLKSMANGMELLSSPL